MSDRSYTRRQALGMIGAITVGSATGCTAGRLTGSDTIIPTQFRRGLQNLGAVAQSIPSTVEIQWAHPTNRGTHTASKGSPVETPTGHIIIADDTGRVRSLTPDGQIQWSTTITDAERGSHGTPAVVGDTTYISAYDGSVTALDTATGNKRWRSVVGDAVGASPTYYNERLYVAVEHADPSGSVVALDADTGAVEWRDRRPTDHPHSTVAIDLRNRRLLLGSNDGHCYAWSFPDLERQWTYDTHGDVKVPIAVADGIAVVPSWAGTVTGVDVTDGSRVWEFAADDKLMCAPAVRNGTVYVGSHDTHLYAIDLANGNQLWATTTGGWITGSAVATRNHVLVGSYDGRLYAVKQADGSITWSVEARGEVTSASLVTNDAIYFAERAVEDRPETPGMCYKLIEPN